MTCRKLPLKTTEEDAHEVKEATASLGAVRQISVDEAIKAFLAIKKEQRTGLEAFLTGKDVFTLLPFDFGKSLIKYCGTSKLAMGL